MNKALRIILIIPIVIFGLGFLVVPSTKAIQIDELVVEYWSETENKWLHLQGPIFNETNFLPSQGVTRLVRVTNYSNQTQRIAAEAINENDPSKLGDFLNIVIKKQNQELYNNTLSKFFSDGEVSLSDLAGNGAEIQYDFTITFNPAAGNPLQEKTLGFDILIGFEGTEGGFSLPSPGNSTGGGLPPGLLIFDEAETYVAETSITITWTTTYFSTSQVIYDIVLGKFDLNAGPPEYGYDYSKEGDDSGLEKVTGHSVTITNLLPNTTYYYRAISHGSLAISQEHTFTTLFAGEMTEIKVGSEKIKEGASKEGITATGEVGLPSAEEIKGSSEGVGEEKEIVAGEGVKEEGRPAGEEKETTGNVFAKNELSAAISGMSFSLKLILILIALILLGLIGLRLFRKRKK